MERRLSQGAARDLKARHAAATGAAGAAGAGVGFGLRFVRTTCCTVNLHTGHRGGFNFPAQGTQRLMWPQGTSKASAALSRQATQVSSPGPAGRLACPSSPGSACRPPWAGGGRGGGRRGDLGRLFDGRRLTGTPRSSDSAAALKAAPIKSSCPPTPHGPARAAAMKASSSSRRRAAAPSSRRRAATPCSGLVAKVLSGVHSGGRKRGVKDGEGVLGISAMSAAMAASLLVSSRGTGGERTLTGEAGCARGVERD